MGAQDETRSAISGVVAERPVGARAGVGWRRDCQGTYGAKRSLSLKTFLDSGVLLTAWRGESSPQRQSALELMADEQREFYTSDNVKLELLPKPAHEKRRMELEF